MKKQVLDRINVIVLVAGTIIALGALFVSVQSNRIAQQANEEKHPQIKVVEVRVVGEELIKPDNPNMKRSACRTYIRFSNISDVETTLLSVRLKINVLNANTELVASDRVPFSWFGDPGEAFMAIARNNDNFWLSQFLEEDVLREASMPGLPFSIKPHSTNDVIVDLMLSTKLDNYEVKLLSTYEKPLNLDEPFTFSGKPEELVTVNYSLSFPDVDAVDTQSVPCFQMIPK